MRGEDVPDWDSHAGVPLLRGVVQGVLDLAEVGDLHSFKLPYPPEAQRALNEITLCCLVRGARPPRSLPDFLSWCRERPVEDWPIELPPDAVAPDQYLIDDESSHPTTFCYEWAMEGPDSSVRDEVHGLIQSAADLCAQAALPESYPVFRRLLVEQPVLDQAGLFRIATDQFLDPVRDLLGSAYRPASDIYLCHGGYTPCRRCSTLLTPLQDGSWWCENDACRQQGAPLPGKPLVADQAGVVHHLDRALRQFVSGPGRAALELEARLRALGVATELWPVREVCDVMVSFPDGHVWTIEVKDHANPALLGRLAEREHARSSRGEDFWVVPGYRAEQCPGYVATFERYNSVNAGGLRLLTDDDLVKVLTRRVNKRTRRQGGENVA